MRRRTRRDALRAAALAGGAGGLAATGARGLARSATSAALTRRALGLVLLVEQVQAGFHGAALDGGKLTGERAQFASVVAPHERAHVNALRGALGAAAADAPRLSFGATVLDPARFTAAAIALEDLAVAAYNGQAANLSPRGARDRGDDRLGRGAPRRWIRAIDGQTPAAHTADRALSQAQVMAALRRTGFLG